MGKLLKILYIKQGIPQIIDEINTDIINALEKNDTCQLDTIDLDPIHQAEKDGDHDRCAELQKQAVEQITNFAPDFAIGYDFRGIMPVGPDNHLLNLLQIPYVGLFFDNPLYQRDKIKHCCNKNEITILCHDLDLIQLVVKEGFLVCSYFPIATSMHQFAQSADDSPLEPPLLFVGGVSMPGAFDDWLAPLTPDQQNFATFAAEQIIEHNQWQQEAILEKFIQTYPLYSGLFDLSDSEFQHLWFIIDKGVTSKLRYLTVESLTDYGIRVCGSFVGWRDTFGQNPNVVLTPTVNYRTELPELYRRHPIVINRSPLNLQNAPQQRIFDVGAAGGFILTDYRPVLEDHFKIGEEIAVYHSLSELRKQVEYYLANPEKRREMAQALHQKVLNEHTWDKRVKQMLWILEQFFPDRGESVD